MRAGGPRSGARHVWCRAFISRNAGNGRRGVRVGNRTAAPAREPGRIALHPRRPIPARHRGAVESGNGKLLRIGVGAPIEGIRQIEVLTSGLESPVNLTLATGDRAWVTESRIRHPLVPGREKDVPEEFWVTSSDPRWLRTTVQSPIRRQTRSRLFFVGPDRWPRRQHRCPRRSFRVSKPRRDSADTC